MTDRLAELTNAWKIAKQQEESSRERRISVESQIYEMLLSHLPEKGTYTTETGMKIATAHSEDWDQAALAIAYQQWPVETVRFPFSSVYKPDGKAIGVIRDSIPELYRVIQPALTLKPRKPSFSLSDSK